ncbi:MAG: tetraacyldisaccharide 4'-kinase [Bacteroidetes bacterium]|nr:tetraacyldisaccharide 4'-kinase [Bacteroidota bacterium]
MLILRILLLPLSFLYGYIVGLRNKLFDWKILRSESFDVPVISVGNLTVGGTGKSPHIQYLIELLHHGYKVATVSRGYKRKSKGFIELTGVSTVDEVGDEPKQFKMNFPTATITVAEKRADAIHELLKKGEAPQVILLDDAYQHRWVRPGLNVLLIDYNYLQEPDFMLPSGTLREWKSGQTRANIIIVTKSPKILSPMEKRRFIEVVAPTPSQVLYFSYIQYQRLKPMTPAAEKMMEEAGELKLSEYKILLFTGIANSGPLMAHLSDNCREVQEIKFPDHYNFNKEDLQQISTSYRNLLSNKKVIITTEKDAVRLLENTSVEMLAGLPLFYIPIEIKFHDEKNSFNELILDFVKHTANSAVHTI